MSLRPFLKMVSSDFVGYIPAKHIVKGDVLLGGLVLDVEYDGDDLIVATTTGFEVFSDDEEVFRIARLTKVSYEDYAKPAYEAGRK